MAVEHKFMTTGNDAPILCAADSPSQAGITHNAAIIQRRDKVFVESKTSAKKSAKETTSKKTPNYAHEDREGVTVPQSNSAPSIPLSEFRRFPKLPVELRLRIWRFAFPQGRHVSLCTESELSREELSRFHSGILTEPIPITLHINSESRTETLKHYQIFYQSEVPNSKSQSNVGKFDRPLVINPKMDLVVLSLQLMLEIPLYLTDPIPEYKTCVELDEWMEYLDKNLTEGLNSIKSLTLVGETRQSLDEIQTTMFPDISEVEVGRYTDFGGERSGMEWFRSLEELRISTCILHERVAEMYQKEMITWFKEYSAKIPSWSIPKKLIWRDV